MSTSDESSLTSSSTILTVRRRRRILTPPSPPTESSTSSGLVLFPYFTRGAVGIFSRLKCFQKPDHTTSETRNLPIPSTSKQTPYICPHPEHRCLLTRSASESQIENIVEEIPISTHRQRQPFVGTAFFKKLIKSSKRTKSLESLRNVAEFGEIAEEALGSNSHKKDHLYKILVIGDLGTGKTSIIKRYVHRFFTQHYRATIGVDFALKVMNWDEHTTIRLQLWDIAGQERYGNMTRVYYKEAVGAFIVFDVTRRTTFESVVNWKADLDAKVQLPDGSPIPCVLLANKCDQQKEGLVTNPTKMEEYCNENGFAAWLETSARDNINIDEAAKTLVQKILEVDNIINKNKGGDQFTLTAETNAEQSKKKCQC